MFVGFNAHITEQGVFSPHFYDYGIETFKDQKASVESTLSKYVLDNEIIDAARLEEDWFPSRNNLVYKNMMNVKPDYKKH